MAQPSTIQDAVCLGCGCMCDDVRLELAGAKLAKIDPPCELGRQWFADALAPRDGGTCDQKLSQAARLLTAARSPLVCGLRGAASDAIREALAIADRLGACADWTTRAAEAASVISFQSYGAVAASLGEVAQRADLVIFWRCDPAATHPRHLQRYSLDKPSPWLPDGRASRQVVLVGNHESATAKQADLIVESPLEEDLAALTHLRGHLSGTPLEEDQQSTWKAIAERIAQSQYTAFFYDTALKQQGHAALSELTLLAQAAQDKTRLAVLPLGGGDNSHGAQSVMAWQTGYPMAVSFARGFPESRADDFATNTLLERGEADAALIVSANGIAGLSDAALGHLRRIPTVVLAEQDATPLSPDVEFRVAPLGATPGGNVYRCDGLSLPLENELSPGAVSHRQVLRGIGGQLGAAPAGVTSLADAR